MNGAMAELCARISSRAKTPSVTRMGVIHQRLLLQKKAKSSPAIPKRWPVVFKKPMNISYLQKSGLKLSAIQFPKSHKFAEFNFPKWAQQDIATLPARPHSALACRRLHRQISRLGLAF